MQHVHGDCLTSYRKSHHWVSSNAFNYISWRYKLKFQWSCHNKRIPLCPNSTPYLLLAIHFFISLTSLKNITINYLRDLPLYAHYGWLHPPSLLVKWPWEGGHSCLPQAPGSSELWPEQPRGNGLGSAKDMSWEHTIYRNMMGIWFGISWKYHKQVSS